MVEKTPATGLTRRELFLATAAGFASATIVSPAKASDEAAELIKRLTGRSATASDRLHLVMPRTFPNGYTVPLNVDIDSPMTENDYVRYCLLYTSPSPRDRQKSRMPSSA